MKAYIGIKYHKVLFYDDIENIDGLFNELDINQ